MLSDARDIHDFFRVFLTVFLLVLLLYTGIVIADHGWNLFQAFFGGMVFLTVYLLIVSFKVEGDTRALLLGVARANSYDA